MGKIVSIDLDPKTAAAYESLTGEQSRLVAAEMRQLIERSLGQRHKDSARLRKLAEYHQSMTPDGERLTDSTAFIRWDRDTNHGKWVNDGWSDSHSVRD